MVALKSCGVAKDLKKCRVFFYLFLPEIMARTWRGPFFSPLNHERVDFFPSSLEAIDTTPQPKSGGIAQNKANLVSTFEKKTWSNTMYMWQIYEEIINICRSSWVVPLPSNSRHQDCYIFATLTGKGDNPIYVCK